MWTPEGDGLRGGHERSAGMWPFLGRGGGISSTGKGLADPQGAMTADNRPTETRRRSRLGSPPGNTHPPSATLRFKHSITSEI